MITYTVKSELNTPPLLSQKEVTYIFKQYEKVRIFKYPLCKLNKILNKYFHKSIKLDISTYRSNIESFQKYNEKFKIIQESMFSVHPWACLPVGENAYFKKASINYDEPVIRDRLNEMPYYAEANNIMNLAQCINDFIINPKLREKWGERAYYMLKNGETETYLLKEACRKLNDILNYAIR